MTDTKNTSLYEAYLEQIEARKDQGLHPKPIEDAEFVEELIAQIQDPEHVYRADSLHFFIYNTLPGTTPAAGVKARFLKEIVLGTFVIPELAPAFALDLLSYMKGGPSVEVLLDLVLGGEVYACRRCTHRLEQWRMGLLKGFGEDPKIIYVSELSVES